MNRQFAIWIAGALAVVSASRCHAAFNGSDDFNASSEDTTKWGADTVRGTGFLTQTNGRLLYTAIGTNEFALRPWRLNYGSYTQSWAVQVDAGVPPIGVKSNQYVHCGVLVYPGTNSSVTVTNRFQVTMSLNQLGDPRVFRCALLTNATQYEVGRQVTTSTLAAVRITFDPTTRLLSAFYDEDGPICGYSWRFLGATNLDAGWRLNTSSRFGVMVFGASGGAMALPVTNVFADNFRTSTGPTPTLKATVASSKLVLSWPTNPPASYLESVDALTKSNCWQIVTNAVATAGTNFVVTNSILKQGQFYRLNR